METTTRDAKKTKGDAMTFTDKKPTVPGAYAIQLESGEEDLVRVYESKATSTLEFEGAITYGLVDDKGILWSSRLVPVEEVGITNVSDEMIAEIANRLMRWTIPSDLISDPCMLRKQTGRTGTNMIDVINAIALVQEVVKPVVEEYIQHARRVVEGRDVV